LYQVPAVHAFALTVNPVNFDSVNLTLIVNNYNVKSDQTKVDCLVCHQQTGTYKKFPAGAGNPAPKPMVFKGNGKTYHPPQWNKVTQSVGRPIRKNWGTQG